MEEATLPTEIIPFEEICQITTSHFEKALKPGHYKAKSSLKEKGHAQK